MHFGSKINSLKIWHPEVRMCFLLAKYNQERLHEKCNCKEKCEVNSYQASISRASFPSQPILDDVKESLGHSEDDIRFYWFILLFSVPFGSWVLKLKECVKHGFLEYPFRNPMNWLITFKFCRKNFLELRIYFEELNYNYIKEYASYTLGNFWCK